MNNTPTESNNYVLKCNLGYYNYLLDLLIQHKYQTKANFSKAVDLHRVVISGIVWGRVVPDPYQRDKISQALNIPADILFQTKLMKKLNFSDVFDLMKKKNGENNG